MMPLNQKILLVLSPLQLAAVITVFFALLSIIGIVIVRRFIPNKWLKAHNDVAGPIFGVIGTVYAVLLAFVVVITWEGHDAAKRNINVEVGAVIGLFMDAEGLKEPVRQELKALVLEYVESVINDEWKTLKTGNTSPAPATTLYNIVKLCGSYRPENRTEEIFLEKAVDRVDELYSLRRQRQLDSRNGIHPILWMVLIIGGVLTIVIGCFFGTESVSLQIALTASLAALIAIVLFTILELDFPFTGKIGIPPTAFQEVLVRLKTY
jgi:hypothetical protein